MISVGAASANAHARTRKDTLIGVMDGNASKWMDDIGALDTPQGIPGISSPLRRKMSAIATELPIMATVRLAQDRETSRPPAMLIHSIQLRRNQRAAPAGGTMAATGLAEPGIEPLGDRHGLGRLRLPAGDVFAPRLHIITQITACDRLQRFSAAPL